MYNEICITVNQLKSNKAVGTGNIPQNLLTNVGRTLKLKLYKLILKVFGFKSMGQSTTSNTVE
jgi:hypothetical protein